jgi:hypothetical protein
MPYAEGGFSGGFARGAGAAVARKQVTNEADQIRDLRNKQIQERLKAAVDASEKSSVDTYKEYVTLISQAVQNGASADQVQQLADSAIKPLQGHALVLGQMRSQAVAAGATPDIVELLPDPNRFIADHIGLLQGTVNNALQQTPEAVAAREAEGKMVEAQEIARRLGQPVEKVAQAMGIIPAPPQPFEALGPDGKPAFVERGPTGALQPVAGATPIPRRGMTIETTPDGGVRVTMGGEGEESGMERPTLARLEKSIVDSQEGLGRLFEVQRGFRPDFLTYGGKFENWRLGTASKINPALLSPEDRKFLADYTAFTTDAIDNMNRYIRDMTGAQLSEFEAERLRKGVPDPERDGPPVFEAKMNTQLRQFALARARAIYTHQQGLDKMPFEAMELEEMDQLINRRADELTSKFAASGMPGQEARSKALDQVKQEFGL